MRRAPPSLTTSALLLVLSLNARQRTLGTPETMKFVHGSASATITRPRERRIVPSPREICTARNSFIPVASIPGRTFAKPRSVGDRYALRGGEQVHARVLGPHLSETIDNAPSDRCHAADTPHKRQALGRPAAVQR